MGSVPNSRQEISMRDCIRWFKCKLKPPKNYSMYICVGKLQNIYFNMKDSDHLGKCNFLFLYLRQ